MHLRPAEEIVADPAFRAARTVWVDAMLHLYENDPFLSRLLAETMRSNVFFHILTLDSVHDPGDRATWPTMGRLQESLVRYGLSSPRRIDALVSRLVGTGYVVQQTVSLDRRVRLLVPTEKMLTHHLDWLRVHYAGLATLFPRCGYAPPLRRDRVFRRVLCRISASVLDIGARNLDSNPNITLIMNHEAGMLVLTKLVQAGAERAPVRIVLTDLGDRFGISRTHVRRVLQEAERAGLLRIGEAGVKLEPPLVAAFDRFVADCLSAFDFMYQLAMNEPEMQAG